MGFASSPVLAQTASAGPIKLNMWAPEGVTRFKAIMAFTSVGAGHGWAASADFRAAAKRIDAAVVTVSGESPLTDPTYPTRCARGEFKLLLDAFTALGKAANHPELANAPIIGYGHSHGGDYWNYFNACYPDRMALIVDKSSGGVQYRGQALRTPMVWEVGTGDLHDSRGHFRAQSFAHRSKGAPMTLILGPGEDHNSISAASRGLMLDAAEAIFKLRVPADADGSKGPVVLNDIDESKGAYWLGDNYTREIGAYPGFPGKDALPKTSFLPTEAFAQKWKMMVPALPATIQVDTGGVCTGCYKELADEPPLRPFGTGPSSPPPTSDGGVPNVDPPALPDASADADVTPPSTGEPKTDPKPPTTGTPKPRDPMPPKTKPAAEDPEEEVTTDKGDKSSGCTATGMPLQSWSGAWLLAVAVALLVRRRRTRR